VSDGGDEARIESDPPRLLARHSELGYVEDLHRALHDEPEAVPASYQARLSADAERRDREQRLRAWRTARGTIAGALVDFRSSCRVPRSLESSIRVIERQIVQLDRRI
jgi:hypothetical protein